jgi:hypothetical protein
MESDQLRRKDDKVRGEICANLDDLDDYSGETFDVYFHFAELSQSCPAEHTEVLLEIFLHQLLRLYSESLIKQ